MDIKILSKKEFPPQLLEIPDVPEKLYLVGKLPPIDAKILCVVGSREHTSYGQDVCEKLIASLAGKNVSIVSGLALGIDTIAHKTALENGLHTLAIPGSGLALDSLHPQRNVKLAQSIIEAGGGLLSEYEPDFKATPWSFPRRNRIMAGLSQAVMVIEATQKSGTLITSKLATDYNRDVFAVPGSIFSKHTWGPHMLMRLGATPITKVEDLHEALGFEVQLTLPNSKYEDCTAYEKRLIELLDEPISKDDLIYESGLSVSDAQMALSLLEMKGYTREKMGKVELVH